MDDVAAQDKSNEIRIGPITRARAKLLEQQVNSLLVESDIFINENFILPKSLHLCMIRFDDNTSIARGGGDLRQDQVPLISNIKKCAREEREAGAPQGEKHESSKDKSYAAPKEKHHVI